MRADLRRSQQEHILGSPLLQYSRSRECSFLGPSDHAFELALEFGLFPVYKVKSCLISCITDIFKEKTCKDRICPLPAIELGLLQRNVSIRVTLAFLLNIPFSLLQWTERFSSGPSEVQFMLVFMQNVLRRKKLFTSHLRFILFPKLWSCTQRPVDSNATSWEVQQYIEMLKCSETL